MHINSGRKLKDLPELKSSDQEVRRFLNRHDMVVAPTDYASIAFPAVSMERQDTMKKGRQDKNEREAKQALGGRRGSEVTQPEPNPENSNQK